MKKYSYISVLFWLCSCGSAQESPLKAVSTRSKSKFTPGSEQVVAKDINKKDKDSTELERKDSNSKRDLKIHKVSKKSRTARKRKGMNPKGVSSQASAASPNKGRSKRLKTKSGIKSKNDFSKVDFSAYKVRPGYGE